MSPKASSGASLYDYLNWRGDLTYTQVGVGEADNLIFSIISYIDFSASVAEEFPETKPPVLLNATKKYLQGQQGILKDMGLMLSREIIALLVKASKTPRFGLVRPVCYVNRICGEQQKQFSAISFLLPTGDVFVAYRGTDDSLVGWKENLNMCFMHPVPAQSEALEYLEMIASKTSGKIYVGGHSKGGNLAVFAAVKASKATKERIVAVYSNDGPGFNKDFIKGADYRQMRERIHTYVPQSSIVGRLLEHEERYKVVKSRSDGLLQHDGLSWDIKGGGFVYLDDTDEESTKKALSIKKWLDTLSTDERMKFVDALYDAIVATDAKTLSELNSDKFKLIKMWNTMDPVARTKFKTLMGIILGFGTNDAKSAQKKEQNGK